MHQVLALAACSGGDDAPAKGKVSVSLMDRPVDGVTALFVTITEVWIKPAGSGPAYPLTMTTTPLTVNLLEHDDQTAAVLVESEEVRAGGFNWIELVVDDSTLYDSYAKTIDGGDVPVDIDVPSDSIRLVSGFDVGENHEHRIVLDWDVRKGLVEAVGTGELKLRPAFRILHEYGAIVGSISRDRITQEPSCADVTITDQGTVVYVFASGVTPQEMDGAAPEPITTVPASYNSETMGYDYRVVLPPGDYVLAATCEGDEDGDGPGDGIVLFPAEGLAGSIGMAGEVDEVSFLFVE
jgi:hypothetical protein